MNKNKEACHCHNVTYGQIMDAVANGATTFDQVQAMTHCATGCGKCRDFLEHFVKELVAEGQK